MADLPEFDWRRIGSRYFEIFRNIFQSGGSALDCAKENVKLKEYVPESQNPDACGLTPSSYRYIKIFFTFAGIDAQFWSADGWEMHTQIPNVNYKNNQLHLSLRGMWREPYCVKKN